MTASPGPPEPPPYRVAQPRLEALVTDLLRRPLTLLIAGPGFGKTTLAATATRDRRCAWLPLEDAEPDLSLLVRRAVGALAPHLPGWRPELLTAARPTVEREDAYRAASIAGALCEEIGERLTGELVLVIDGVPALRTGRAGIGVPGGALPAGPGRAAPAPHQPRGAGVPAPPDAFGRPGRHAHHAAPRVHRGRGPDRGGERPARRRPGASPGCCTRSPPAGRPRCTSRWSTSAR